jgi:hypothetical protein
MQIESVHEDGTVVFLDGNAVVADFIVHCTGYAQHILLVKFSFKPVSMQLRQKIMQIN